MKKSPPLPDEPPECEYTEGCVVHDFDVGIENADKSRKRLLKDADELDKKFRQSDLTNYLRRNANRLSVDKEVLSSELWKSEKKVCRICPYNRLER